MPAGKKKQVGQTRFNQLENRSARVHTCRSARVHTCRRAQVTAGDAAPALAAAFQTGPRLTLALMPLPLLPPTELLLPLLASVLLPLPMMMLTLPLLPPFVPMLLPLPLLLLLTILLLTQLQPERS